MAGSEKIYRATREISNAFDKKDLKYKLNTTSNSSAVEAGYSGDNVSGVKMLFISRDDDNDVAVRAFNVVRGVSEAKRGEVLKLINSLHAKYRYVRFVLDEDGCIDVEYDFPVEGGNIGEASVEIFVRLAKIIDEAYPQFMKTMWA